MLLATFSVATADPLIVQGSSTFNRRVFEPHEADIEKNSGQEVTVIPNRTMLGIIALLKAARTWPCCPHRWTARSRA